MLEPAVSLENQMSKSLQLQIPQQRCLELGPRPGLRGGTQGTQGILRHTAEEVGLDPEASWRCHMRSVSVR